MIAEITRFADREFYQDWYMRVDRGTLFLETQEIEIYPEEFANRKLKMNT
jgi:hypothetical protein